MLRSLKIENFRSFKSFELQQLGRINLLVGQNNSGKTSILEAIGILCTSNYEKMLNQIMSLRDEMFWDESMSKYQPDLTYLFNLNKNNANKFFTIKSTLDRGENVENYERLLVAFTLEAIDFLVESLEKQGELSVVDPIKRSVANYNFSLSVSSHLSLKPDFIYKENIHFYRFNSQNNSPIYNQKNALEAKIVTSKSISPKQSIDLFESIMLNPEEDMVIDALRILEPNLNRVAVLSPERHQYPDLDDRGRFIVKLADRNQRIPLGSMGEGMTRILGLALSLVDAKGGILLVDEIDTGLHFSAMSDMWRMIWHTANKLDIQVFATTHNSDCWTSLAEIIQSENIEGDDVTIHRIEKGKTRSVMFDREEIIIAAERGIEVR